jgi:hypothetical protein
MAFLDVRRVAAADMYGTSGSSRRRRAIRAEFLIGAVACIAFGAASLALGHGWGRPVGAWLACLGLNYVPLAASARAQERSGVVPRRSRVRRCLPRQWPPS